MCRFQVTCLRYWSARNLGSILINAGIQHEIRRPPCLLTVVCAPVSRGFRSDSQRRGVSKMLPRPVGLRMKVAGQTR